MAQTQLTVTPESASGQTGTQIELDYSTDASQISVESSVPEKASVQDDKERSKIIVNLLQAGEVNVIVKATSEGNEETVKSIPVSITAAETEPTALSLSKESTILNIGTTEDITVTAEAEWSVESSDPAKCAVEKKDGKFTLTPKVVGSVNVTVKSKASGKLETSKVLQVTVQEQAQLPTELTLSKESVIIKKESNLKIGVTTNADTFEARSLNSDKVGVEKQEDGVLVKGLVEGTGVVEVSATKSGSTKTTKQINVEVIAKDSVTPPDTGGNMGITPIPSQESVSKRFLTQFQDYENTAEITLARVVKVTAWDVTNAGKFVKNYVMKQLIMDMVRNKVGNVQFVNLAYAKSAIALILTLNKSNYGSDLSDIQKDRLIRKICSGSGIKFDS